MSQLLFFCSCFSDLSGTLTDLPGEPHIQDWGLKMLDLGLAMFLTRTRLMQSAQRSHMQDTVSRVPAPMRGPHPWPQIMPVQEEQVFEIKPR